MRYDHDHLRTQLEEGSELLALQCRRLLESSTAGGTRAWQLRWLWKGFDELLSSADQLGLHLATVDSTLGAECQRRLDEVKLTRLDVTALALTPEVDDATFASALCRFERAWESFLETALLEGQLAT